MAGSELDYVSTLTSSGFKIKNPNAAAECSCGQSFTV
jgi:iron-sulfur cluster assembly protein